MRKKCVGQRKKVAILELIQHIYVCECLTQNSVYTIFTCMSSHHKSFFESSEQQDDTNKLETGQGKIILLPAN